MAKKPKGWKAFDKLARGLANVDKGKVDKKIAADKAKRVRGRQKKKSLLERVVEHALEPIKKRKKK